LEGLGFSPNLRAKDNGIGRAKARPLHTTTAAAGIQFATAIASGGLR